MLDVAKLYDEEQAPSLNTESLYADEQLNSTLDLASVYGEEPDLSEGEPDYNKSRAFVERIADLGGSFLGLANDIASPIADFVDDQFGASGGFVWEEGDYLPSWLSADKFQEYRRIKSEGKGFFDTLEADLKDFDAGYIPQATWDTVKHEFSEGGLSLSAMSEVIDYGLETGVVSFADMGGMILNFPGYVMARSGEIGDIRAKNSGRDEGDLVDTLEAAPFAIGSALFDRYGLDKMFGGAASKEGLEQIGKEILERGFAKVAATRAGTAVATEAGTEAFQEGVIEYIGERFGTEAAMDWKEAADRGVGAAVAGGMMGGTVSGATTSTAAVIQGRRGDTLDQTFEKAGGDPEPVVEGDLLDQTKHKVSQESKKIANNAVASTFPEAADYLDQQTQIIMDEKVTSDELETITEESGFADLSAYDDQAAERTDETKDIYELALELAPELEEASDPVEVMGAVTEAVEQLGAKYNWSAAEQAEHLEKFDSDPQALADDLVAYAAGDVEESAEDFWTEEGAAEKVEVTTEEKLLNPTYQDQLRYMINELTVNGGSTQIKPDEGQYGKQSKSLNPEWFQEMLNDKERHFYSVMELGEKVEKALSGKKLTAKETTALEIMIDVIEESTTENLQHMIEEKTLADSLPEHSMAAQKARHAETATTRAFDKAAAVTDPTGESGAKGVADFQGVKIALENPKGTVRSGVDTDGKKWETELAHDYGEIEGTKGADGDPVDAFIGTNYDSNKVFVVDQVDPKTGKFDEHKVVFGAEVREQAEHIYDSNYADDWEGRSAITEMTTEEFKKWAADPKNTVKPAAVPALSDNLNPKIVVRDSRMGNRKVFRIEGGPPGTETIEHITEAQAEKALRVVMPKPAAVPALEAKKLEAANDALLPKQNFNDVTITLSVENAKGKKGKQTNTAQVFWNRTQKRLKIAEELKACVQKAS